MPARKIHLSGAPAWAIAYSDACFEPGKPAGIAYVISSPCLQRPRASRLVLTVEELACFLPRKTQINQLECIGVMAALYNEKAVLRGKDVLFFVDNLGALAALVAGYSRNGDAADISACFHIVAAEIGCRVWFEWVDSKANIIDELSRSPSGLRPEWDLVPSTLPRPERLGNWGLDALAAAFGSD